MNKTVANLRVCFIYFKGTVFFCSGMLPDAVLPPTDDHTYAQWLEREDPPISPQPSPFKRMSDRPLNRVVVPMGMYITTIRQTSQQSRCSYGYVHNNHQTDLSTESLFLWVCT